MTYNDQCQCPDQCQTDPTCCECAGKAVQIVNPYGSTNELCPPDGCGILVHDAAGAKPVRWGQGNSASEIPLCSAVPVPAGKELLVRTEDNNLRPLAPDPTIPGPQIPMWRSGEIKMVKHNEGEACFHEDEIGQITDADSFDGLAGFVACKDGVYCLHMIPPCLSGEVIRQPIGTGLWWIGCDTNVPDGYIIADGRSLSTEVYPDLFQRIGYTWGGDGQSFRLPDMRGRVARGVDSDLLRDTTSRYYYAGNAGIGIGTYQDSHLQCHEHEQGEGEEAVGGVGLKVTRYSTTIGPHGRSRIYYVHNVELTTTSADIDFSVGNAKQHGTCGPVTTSANETTMHNAAMYFIISAGCAVEC